MSEAIFATEDVLQVGPPMLDLLKQRAGASARGRYRLCLHHGTDHGSQEMAIVQCRGTYVRPHRHLPTKSKSYHIIEGHMTVFLFDDAGRVTERIKMGPLGSDRTFLLRLVGREWYLPVAETEMVIYHEVFPGPFEKDVDVEYAPWSPDEDDLVAAAEYLRAIRA